MQLSFGLSQVDCTRTVLFKPKQEESRAYISLSGCVLEHIILTHNLSDLEKLFYILVNSLSLINLHGGSQRAIALSAESWSERLNCAKSLIFAMQKSLESKGYFIVSKDKNKHGQNKRNLICPTLPDDVFKHLSETADNRVGGGLLYAPAFESKMQYLDRTKLFIILSYQVLKDITACKYLTPFHKLVWLDFYITCYKARVVNLGSVLSIDDIEFSFITSYGQLQDKYSCNKSVISSTLIDLEELGLIKREHFYTKKEFGDQERQDRSLWKISLVSAEHISSGNNHDSINGSRGSSGRFSHFPYYDTVVRANLSANTIKSARRKKLGIVPTTPSNNSENESKEQYIDLVASELSQDYISDSEGLDSKQERQIDNSPYSIENNYDSDAIDYEVEAKLSLLENPMTSQESGDICCDDPEILLSSLYYNKDNIINIYKSNLVNGHNSKNNSSEYNLIEDVYTKSNNKTTKCTETIKNGWQNNMCWGDSAKNENKGVFRGVKFLKRKIHEVSKFNVCTSLIKERLKLLSKDKADKARKFAYSLFSKKLAKGYASSLSKHELAKQFIFHATTWKPTKIVLGASDDKLVDVALSVAWNAVVNGDWQEPLEWAKAKALQFEFLDYKNKYRESGIVSNEIRSLESIVNNSLGVNYDLTAIIIKEVKELRFESAMVKEPLVTKESDQIALGRRIEDLELLSDIAATANNNVRKVNQQPISITTAEENFVA